MTVHLSLLCLLSLAPLSVIAEKITHDYCIVGAGPAGLQLGFFLNRDGHDYVIFEKSDVAGSFFAKYPRHRQLISINKRFTGRYNKEFNLRHDWNSLMSDDDDLLFGKYSEEYFPDADDYLKYLADYQRKLAINVKFNTEVSNISQSQQKGCKFEMQDQHENNYCCKRVLVIANGISDPIVSHGVGHDLIEGYESMSVNPKEFDGQSVLIFGRGNSALETAKSLYGHAAYLNLAARSRLRFSWDTHYVGDIRGINNEVLDSYHLKSLDGILEGMSIEEVDIVRRTDGKLDLIPNKKSHISLEDMDHNPVRHGYDRILRCIGFQWDKSLFNANTTPALSKTSSGKYPLMGTDYQSLQFPGMYFAGALAHSLDWRKSAGGFIHGFRYTTRALYRMLGWSVHQQPWPIVYLPVEHLMNTFLKRANEASGIYQMFGQLGDFAIYNREMQSFAYLEEFPVSRWNKIFESSGYKFENGKHLLFTMTMEYGANFSKPGNDNFGDTRVQSSLRSAELSNFLHPVFRVFRSVPSKDADITKNTIFNTKPIGLQHLLEDFTTEFSAVRTHIAPLRKFFEFFTELDLRPHLPENCLNLMLTTHVYDAYSSNVRLPVECRNLVETEESIALYS